MNTSKVIICNNNPAFPSDFIVQSKYAPDKFQCQAFEQMVLGRDILVCVPTGSGKTDVAINAIVYTIKILKKKVVYTAPIKALSNEKFRDLRYRLKQYNISVGILTGDNKINPDADFIIATTEIIRNSLFRVMKLDESNYELSNDYIIQIGCLIIDEVHYINDKDRGCVWEIMMMLIDPSVQVIMLSGTIGNPEIFCTWFSHIRNKKIALIQETKRIVPLTHHVFIDKCYMYLDSESRYYPTNFNDAKMAYNERQKLRVKNHKHHDERADIISYVKYSQKNNLLPAIIFLFSRNDCEKYAKMIDSLNFLDQEEKERSKHIFDQFLAKHRKEHENLAEFDEMKQLLQRGIGYHHADVLQHLREIVEILMKEKLIKVLFATETMAIGLNVPAKSTAFISFTKFSSEGKRDLYTSEYRQMGGRAGRRGIDTEGTIVYLPLKELSYEEDLRKVVTGPNPNLISNFKLDYQSILKLAQMNINVVEFYEKSYMYFHDTYQIHLLEKENARLAQELEQCIINHNAIELGQENKEMVKKYFSYEEKINSKFVLDKKQDAEYKLLKGTIHKDAEMQKYCESEKKLKSVNDAFNINLTKIEVYRNFIVDLYEKFRSVLEDLNLIIKDNNQLITKESITTKGIICSFINDCNSLMLTEIITGNYLNNLTVQEIVSFLSIFVEPVRKDKACGLHEFDGTETLHNSITKLDIAIKSIEQIEKKYMDELLRTQFHICTDFMDLAYEWGDDKKMHDMLPYFKDYDIRPELFRKTMIKIGNIVNVVINIIKWEKRNLELIPKLEECIQKIQRDIVMIVSLYLQ
jgi:superfamily II RNA helicase